MTAEPHSLPLEPHVARLEVRHVGKRFDGVTAVQDVSFTVEHGAFTALLGPSGCGKTTLLRIIAGFTRPDRGTVLVNGTDIGPLPAEKRHMGLVFQSYALFPHLTVAENIAFGLHVRHLPRHVVRTQVEQALALVRLEGLGGRKPSQLSGGQQQRVALARALVIEPDILLLDEPLSALDRAIRLDMQAELRHIQQELGVTTVFVTHDQEEALTLANQVVVLRAGVVQQHGAPHDLYMQPANLFVATFLGAANVIPGILEEGPEGGWCVRYGPVQIPVTCRSGFHAGEPVQTIIRPEWLSLRSRDDKDATGLLGRISAMRFVGPLSEVTLQVGDVEMRALTLTSTDAPWRVNDVVSVGINRQDLPVYHRADNEREASEDRA